MATVINKKNTISFPRKTKRKKDKVKTYVINLYFLMFFLIVGIAVTSFLFLSEFNDISSQGVIIGDLETDRSRLIIENEVWNMRIAKLKSMDVIEKQDVVKRMVTIDPAEIEFIDLDRIRENENKKTE